MNALDVKFGYVRNHGALIRSTNSPRVEVWRTLHGNVATLHYSADGQPAEINVQPPSLAWKTKRFMKSMWQGRA